MIMFGHAFVSMLAVALFFNAEPPSSCLQFACYPPSTTWRGHAAKPKFTGARHADPHFREAVLFDLKKGSNFAGAYTLVETTCGTGCAYIVVVDTRTGEIFDDLPFGLVQVGSPITFHGYTSYRLTSRLLVLAGEIGGVSKKPVKAYYEWREPGFSLLSIVPLR